MSKSLTALREASECRISVVIHNEAVATSQARRPRTGLPRERVTYLDVTQEVDVLPQLVRRYERLTPIVMTRIMRCTGKSYNGRFLETISMFDDATSDFVHHLLVV